jgi:hypothetical protein
MTNFAATAIIDRRYDDRVVVDIVDDHGVVPLVFTDPEGLGLLDVFDRLLSLGWVAEQITAQRLRENVTSVRLRRHEESKIVRIKRFRAAAPGLIGLKLAKDVIEAIDLVGRDADIAVKATVVARFLVHESTSPGPESLALATAWIELAGL